MRNVIIALAALAAVAVTTTAASAADIYVDGQKVDFVAKDNLDKCELRYDAQGNLHITTPKNAFVVSVPAEAGDNALVSKPAPRTQTAQAR
jgi:hypothetical protein